MRARRAGDPEAARLAEARAQLVAAAVPLLPPVQRALAVAPAAAPGAPALQLAPRAAAGAEAGPLDAAAEHGPAAPADARAAQPLLAGLAGLAGPAGPALLTRAGARGLGPPPLLGGVLAAAVQAGDHGAEADGAAGAAARDADGDVEAAQARGGGAGAAAPAPLLTGGPAAGPGRGAAPPPQWGAWRGAQASGLPWKLCLACDRPPSVYLANMPLLCPDAEAGRASSAAAERSNAIAQYAHGRWRLRAGCAAWRARVFVVLSKLKAALPSMPQCSHLLT